MNSCTCKHGPVLGSPIADLDILLIVEGHESDHPVHALELVIPEPGSGPPLSVPAHWVSLVGCEVPAQVQAVDVLV